MVRLSRKTIDVQFRLAIFGTEQPALAPDENMYLQRNGTLILLLSISALYCLAGTLSTLGPLLWIALAISTVFSLVSSLCLKTSSALLKAISSAVAVLAVARLLVFFIFGR